MELEVPDADASALGARRLDLTRADTWLTAAEQALAAGARPAGSTPSGVASQIAWARALLASTRGDTDGALAAGLAALAGLHATDVAGRSYAAIALSSAYTTRGELSQAETVFAEAVGLGRAQGGVFHASRIACSLSYIQRARGALADAARTCDAALAWSARGGPVGRLDRGPLLASLADVLRERNDLEAALGWANEAVAECKRWGTPDQVALSTLVLGRVREAQGDLAGAQAALDDLAPLEAKIAWLAGIVAAFAAQLRLLLGMQPTRATFDSARAPEVQLRSRPRLLVYAYEHTWIAPVQVFLAQGRDSGDPGPLRQALAELDALEADALWLPWLRIKTLILRGLAYHALDDVPAAVGALRAAVALAGPEGHVRLAARESLPRRMG
jgi:LuxR family maltose regulon positive regulatory protein